MICVIPSLLTSDPKELATKIHRLETLADIIQIDIMDGNFVPNQSILASDLAKVKTRAILEIHLMVTDPSLYIKNFAAAGGKRFAFHIESPVEPTGIINLIRNHNAAAGIALNPGTAPSEIKNIISEIDFIILMSVNPGFQGQKFIAEVLKKIPRIREMSSDITIEIDGGMNLETGRLAKTAGVDILNVGSFLFKDDKLEDNWHRMCKIDSQK